MTERHLQQANDALDRIVGVTRAGPKRTISELIKLWARFVEELRTDYIYTIYDFDNDVTIRVLLDRVLASLRESPAAKELRAELEPIDAQYFMLTSEFRRWEMPDMGETEMRWRNRVPVHQGEDVRMDNLRH